MMGLTVMCMKRNLIGSEYEITVHRYISPGGFTGFWINYAFTYKVTFPPLSSKSLLQIKLIFHL